MHGIIGGDPSGYDNVVFVYACVQHASLPSEKITTRKLSVKFAHHCLHIIDMFLRDTLSKWYHCWFGGTATDGVHCLGNNSGRWNC